MEKLGTIRDVRGRSEIKLRKVIVNKTSIKFGLKKFSKSKIRNMLAKNKGRFECEFRYEWEFRGKSIFVNFVDYGYYGKLQISPPLLTKIKKWANTK